MHRDAAEMDDLRVQALRGAEQAELGVDEGLGVERADGIRCRAAELTIDQLSCCRPRPTMQVRPGEIPTPYVDVCLLHSGSGRCLRRLRSTRMSLDGRDGEFEARRRTAAVAAKR